mgnify:CR=1 FL=1
MPPHLSVHCGSDEERAIAREAQRRQQVVGAALRELGEKHDVKWARYLERCDKLGYERKPPA